MALIHDQPARVLRHLIWVAGIDEVYARDAATWYANKCPHNMKNMLAWLDEKLNELDQQNDQRHTNDQARPSREGLLLLQKARGVGEKNDKQRA